MIHRELHHSLFRKTIIILVLAAALIATNLSIAEPVYAADTGTCGEEVQWIYDNGTLTISGSGDMDISSRGYLDRYQKKITSIVIEDGVTGICDSAFYECTNLTDVFIPGSVRTIGAGAFDTCKKLTAINLPEGLESIGNMAFYGCTGLTEIVIPGSMVENGLRPGAFSGCPNLNSIVMAQDNDYYKSPEGSNCIYAYHSYGLHNVLIAAGNLSVIPEEVDEIGNSVFDGRNITEIVIPEGVTYIHDYAFTDCKKLNRIVLPKSLTKVGFEAFYNCSSLATVYYAGTEDDWNNITISNSSGDEDNDALLEAERIYNASYFEGEPAVSASGSYRILPDGGGSIVTVKWKYLNHVLTIESGNGVYALGTTYYSGDDAEGKWTDDKYNIDRTQIEKIIINNGVRTVGESTFSGLPGLKEILFKGRMQEIQTGAFQNCSNLETVTLTGGANAVQEKAFYSPGAGYSLIVSSGEIGEIGAGAFSGCQKAYFDGNVGIVSGNISSFAPFSTCKEVAFGSNVTKIAAKLMYNAHALELVTMADSVEEIGASAFQLTSSLKSIALGNGMKTIGSGAFFDSGLQEIILPASLSAIEEDAFSGCSSLQDIFYAGSENDWNNVAVAGGNSAFTKGTIFFNCTSRVQAAEQKIYAIGEVTLDSERAILSARQYFDSLNEEEQQQVSQDAKDMLANAETTLADLQAFASMEGVTFADGVLTVSKDIDEEQMPWSAFADEIEKVVFTEGVTKVPERAFYGAANLKEAELAETVKQVGDYAFAYSESLQQVSMPGVEKICRGAFEETALKSVQFSDQLTEIGEYAFYSTKLTEVVIPASVKTIGAQAFCFCNRLNRVYIPKGVEYIGERAFQSYSLEEGGDDINGILYAGSEADWKKITEDRSVGGYYNEDIKVIYQVNNLVEALEQRIDALVKSGYSSKSEESEETWKLNRELNTLAATFDSRWGALTPEERASMTPSCKQAFENLLRDVFRYDHFDDYLNNENEEFGNYYSQYDSHSDENWTSNEMELVNGTLTIHKGAVLDWTKEAAPWTLVKKEGYYRNDALYDIYKIVIEEGVTSIGPSAFAGCFYLKEVQLPASLTSIGDYAFSGCTELRDINIPASVTKIGKYAFDGCYMLKRIYYGGSKSAWDVTAAGRAGKGTVIDNTRSGNYDLLNAGFYESCNSRMEYVQKQLNYFKSHHVTRNNLYEAQSLKAVVVKLPDEDWDSIPEQLRQVYWTVEEEIDDPKPEEEIEDTQPEVVAVKPSIKLSKTSFVYNGKAQKPSVTVTVNSKKISSEHYTVTYPSGCKNVGSYTVKVTMKNGYSGTGSAAYTIIPKGTTVSKVTGAKKAITVKWKKQLAQTTGYQIQYSTNSKFKSGNKTVTVKGAKVVSKKLTKLKAKKKYYVRVRTYKKVGSKTYYSAWSKAKSVKTK